MAYDEGGWFQDEDGEWKYRLPGEDLTPEKEAKLREAIKKCFIPLTYNGVVLTEVCNGDWFMWNELYTDEERAVLVCEFILAHGDGEDVLNSIEIMDRKYGEKKRKNMIDAFICEKAEEAVKREMEKGKLSE